MNYGVSWLERQSNRICLQFEHSLVWSELSASSGVYVGDPSRPTECISMVDPAGGATTFNQAFYLEWCDFLSGVRTRNEALVSARSAMTTTALVERLLTLDGTRNV
jgi:hypothetical protein